MKSSSRLIYYFQNYVRFKSNLSRWNFALCFNPASFRPICTSPSINSVSKSVAITKTSQITPKSVTVEFEDSLIADFYYIWLRDNCQCTLCVHPKTKRKILDTDSINLNISPRFCNVTNNGNLKIVWSEDKGNHSSYYNPIWLHKYGLGFERNHYEAVHSNLPPMKYWNEKYLKGNHLEMDYNEVMGPLKGTDRFLDQFYKFGLVIIRNAPCEVGEVIKVINKISHVNSTKWGSFHIATKDACRNLPHVRNALKDFDFHTDMNYLKIAPGVQVIHCLEKSFKNEFNRFTPGKNSGKYYFVDGFYVADWLRNNYLEHFNTLLSMPIKFKSVGQNMYYINYQPLLKQNKSGDIIEVHFNNEVMAPLEGPSASIPHFYAALKVFRENLRKPQNYFSISLKPGDMIAFNNRRILHKRKRIDSNLVSMHLEGCFADINEIEARYRSSLIKKVK